MNIPRNTLALAAILAVPGATAASAHAFLDHAVPSVGSTVSTPPGELARTFTEGGVPALSGLHLAAAGGKAVALPKPEKVGTDTLKVRLSAKLAPGTYVVTWHVVSVDTHPTSGSYKFTVAP